MNATPPPRAATRPRNPLLPWTWALHWQILLGLVIGIGVGALMANAALRGVSGEVAAFDTAYEAALSQLSADGLSSDDIDRLQATAEAPDATFAAVRAYEAAVAERASRLDQLGTAPSAHAQVTDGTPYLILKLIGDLFLNGLKLIVIPIITTSIILAVAGLGGSDAFRRLGLKTLAYYFTTSFIAILIGITLVNLIAPGKTPGPETLFGEAASMSFDSEAAAVDGKTSGKTASDFLDVFRAMVPPNIVKAANEGNFIGLIIVAMLVGFFATRLAAEKSKAFLGFVEAVYDITLAITHFVLRLAPIGVFGLIAATVAYQVAKLAPDDRVHELAVGIGKFAVTVLLALGLHFFVVMPLILMFVARVNPLKHYLAMGPAIMTAFSTSSSSSTLPVTMECVEERAGVSRKTTSFVLPLGATVNMDGTALFECIAAIFICQAFGIDLSIGQQFMIVVVALLTSVGVAGVPSASIVAIVVILRSVEEQLKQQGVDVPLVAVGVPVIFAIDRPLDMCRTVVNIFSDSVGAVTIARSEGESGVLADG
ncbi:dicarboxylate/amino acid:cation symporter [Phycisphaeraceae bacterium D3-23]